MPFLNADDHILHQDSLALHETTYWPEMDEQDASQQNLLDPYIDPQTVMNASEALMRLSEQDLNIEPSLRSLNVDDSHSFPSMQYPIAGTSTVNQALDMDILNTRSQVAPPAEPFNGAKIRRWTDIFNLARTHALRWTSASGPHASAPSASSLDSNSHTTTHEAVRRPNARQGTGFTGASSSSKVTGLAKGLQ